jgi:hypothetical protein
MKQKFEKFIITEAFVIICLVILPLFLGFLFFFFCKYAVPSNGGVVIQGETI